MEIFSGLQEDLGMECLVRIPYRFHPNLRAVCKSWNLLLSSAIFFNERQRRGECEEGIVSLHKSPQTESDFDVIICYPLGRFLERLPQIPKQFQLEYTAYHRCVFVRSKHQLVIMGLLNRRSDREGVLIFDFLSHKWRVGADMPCSRCYFACAASTTEPLVYIAGGCKRPFKRGFSRPLPEAFVYNVEKNKWDFLPAMNSVPLLDLCVGAFLDDKFYVVPRQSQRGQVYDPKTRLWTNINTDSNAQYVHSCVAACRGLWWFTWKECIRGWINVQEFDNDSNKRSRTDYGQFSAELPDFYTGFVHGIVPYNGGFFLSAVDPTCGVEYFSFKARVENYRWCMIGAENSRFIFSSDSVQI
ncbi:hypothetical protein SUGI_1105750 [Cryptomeria japonica]|uniref:F-box/kelch-repeat protein At1g55270 n=1 Tax=Cryptomeria japonica TaxID=3369 RepID=UPI0024146A23|nr:F-box/kelch-repeat protein At1g55270 [Cryptomeria japonica]GLJ52017.1 hypothetical protein SUGI_1105750 [Cryptomeria japonica]